MSKQVSLIRDIILSGGWGAGRFMVRADSDDDEADVCCACVNKEENSGLNARALQ